MSDVSGLEQRITAALDRIGDGLTRLTQTEAAPTNPGELRALQELLDGEKLANAQLEERVKAIKEKQESLVRNLEIEVTTLRADVAVKNEEAERMKNVNVRLRRNNRALRDANAQGLGDADLINNAMVVELDALRVSHESDRAELDSILVELKPLVEGVASA